MPRPPKAKILSPSDPSSEGGLSEKVRSSTKRPVYQETDLHDQLSQLIPLQIQDEGKDGELHVSLRGKAGNIRLKFQQFKDKGPPWVKMSIAIDDQTTLDAIKCHWSTIQKYRDAICKFQGPEIISSGRGLYSHIQQRLHQANIRDKKGYGSLAKDLNRDIEELLKGYVQDCQLREREAKGLGIEEFFDWGKKAQKEKNYNFKAGERESMTMMTMFGIDEEEAKGYCEDGLQDIRLGKAPIWARGEKPYTEPIDLQQVRKRLEWYRKRYTSPPPKRGASP